MKKAIYIFLENIAKLFKVKSIITIAIIFTVCFLTINGQIDTAVFTTIATLVVQYYFKKDDGKIEGKGEEKNGN